MVAQILAGVVKTIARRNQPRQAADIERRVKLESDAALGFDLAGQILEGRMQGARGFCRPAGPQHQAGQRDSRQANGLHRGLQTEQKRPMASLRQLHAFRPPDNHSKYAAACLHFLSCHGNFIRADPRAVHHPSRSNGLASEFLAPGTERPPGIDEKMPPAGGIFHPSNTGPIRTDPTPSRTRRCRSSLR